MGEKELGGVVDLQEATTYSAIISRSMTNTGNPFTFEDRVYGEKQNSPTDYFYLTDYELS